ncbi:MAG: ATP-binding protein [Alphaproteobacteria bacterium]
MDKNLDDKLFLLDISTNIFLLLDKDGLIHYANIRCSHVLSRSCLEGKYLSDFMPEKEASEFIKETGKALKNGTMDSFNLSFKSRDYIASIYPKGEFVAVCLWDITDNQNLSEQLKKKTRQLDIAEKKIQEVEEQNKAKSYFLAQASHDLRQPMQALKIFISTLSEEELPERQQLLVEKINASADNLYTMLDNLLDISKIESGGMPYHPRYFNLDDLVKTLNQEFSEIARSKKIDYCYIPCHKEVFGDPLFIERIIRNLISNAFKYTKNKIVLGCCPEHDFLKIIVIDNGDGISEEEQKKIFEQFYQCRQKYECKKSGAGLGLFIVKKLTELMNTKIEVESEPGKGSCFYFSIPYKKEAP